MAPSQIADDPSLAVNDTKEGFDKPEDDQLEMVHASMSLEDLTALETKMVRKMDLFVLPIVGILYILNYVDRSGLASAHVYGIVTDLHMTETDYSTAIAILFDICIMATIWGAVSACTALVKNRGQLWAVRVMLGLTEAPFFPGAVYFLSAWYTRQQLAKRIAALYMFQAAGQALGGFIAAGCLSLDGVHGIKGWRWLFIIEGVCTIGVGIIACFIMPEFPHNARMLKPIERDLAVWRLEAESGATEASDDIGTWKAFKLAMADKKLWLIIWCGGMGQTMGSVFNFFPTIISSLGYGKYQTLLLTVPPYVAAAIGYFIGSFVSDRYNVIYWVIISMLSLSFPVYLLGMLSPNTAGRYVAMMFMPVVGVIPQVMLNKIISLHFPRPNKKRAAAIAMNNAIGGISNVWTSYVWFGGPHFYVPLGTLLAAAVVFAASITAYRFWVLHLNKKLGGTPEEKQSVMKNHHITSEQLDLGWRYVGF